MIIKVVERTLRTTLQNIGRHNSIEELFALNIQPEYIASQKIVSEVVKKKEIKS